MLAISIMFTACKKDTSLTEAKKKDPTEQKILNFKEKMLALSGAEGESSNKSNETMSIEDAVWNIEAALNYTYCNAQNSIIENFDTVFVTINIEDDGNINFSNVISAYNQLENNLTNIVGEDNMIVADIEFVETSNKSDEETISLVVARAPAIDPKPNQFYEITDNWYAGHDLGNCSGTVQNWALDNEINKWLARNRAVPANNVYYTNVTSKYFFSYSPIELDMYDGDTWNNIYNGYDHIELYTRENPVIGISPSFEQIFGECVNTTRANFYARETNQALDYIKQYKLPSFDHTLSGWHVQEDFCVRLDNNHPENNEWYGKHLIYATFGIPHITTTIKD